MCATPRPFGLAFAPAPPVLRLNLATHTNSLAHSTKGTPSPLSGLRPAGSTWFQDLFHSPARGSFHRSLTVLVHYRSLSVFSLGMWSSLLPTGFRVSGSTHDPHPGPRALGLRVSHPLRTALPIPFGSTTLPCGCAGTHPGVSFNPQMAAVPASFATWVWAPPGSLAATTGILSFPRGT